MHGEINASELLRRLHQNRNVKSIADLDTEVVPDLHGNRKWRREKYGTEKDCLEKD
jgi:hypothetical protein